MELNADTFNNFFYLYLIESKNYFKTGSKQIDFILQNLDKHKIKNVIDLCCGMGRHSIAFAQKGCSVTGIDNDSKFINFAKRKANEIKIRNIKFIKRDIRELSYRNRFDLILLLFNSFGYFSHRENLSLLKKIYRALRPNGYFVLDTKVKTDNFINKFPLQIETEYKNYTIKFKQSFIKKSSSMKTIAELYKNSENVKKTILNIRIYSFGEIEGMFKRTGFKIIQKFENYKGKKFRRDKTTSILLFARKIRPRRYGVGPSDLRFSCQIY